MKKQGFFERLRNWLDDTAESDPLNGVIDLSQPSKKSEEFMNNILRGLDAILQDEMFVPPKGLAQVPSKFIVFLNPADDYHWQNKKRLALEKNLSDLILERALELAGANSLSATKITVNVKLDKNLIPPMFEIAAFWDEENTKGIKTSHLEPKPAAKKVSENPLFQLMISKNGNQVEEIPIYKRFVLIGREKDSSEVEVFLDDPQISKLQASLVFSDNHCFTVTNYGVNSITVGPKTVQPNETLLFLPTDQIQISSFSLKILSPKFPEKSLLPLTIRNNPFLTVRN
ncbi:MAG: FHA domain-containing protein [Acidobacteriota bacterium]|nr:FHA domain-containing protein [Acidobacteriota bacterium]